jgi:hypothetical protein
LPAGAACSGDGVAGYRVQSYMVPTSVDPSTLTYDSGGPAPQTTGSNFRQPLFKSDTTPYVNAAPNTGDGAIINIPNFKHSAWTIAELPAGDYFLGIACTQPSPNQAQIDKFWVGTVTIVASAADPNGFTWTATAATTTTTVATAATSTTLSTGSTTSTTSATGSTTSTTAGTVATTTSTTSSLSAAGGGTGGTNAAVGAAATGTGSDPGSTGSSPLASTGAHILLMLGAAFLLAYLGRVAVLLARPSSNGPTDR